MVGGGGWLLQSSVRSHVELRWAISTMHLLEKGLCGSEVASLGWAGSRALGTSGEWARGVGRIQLRVRQTLECNACFSQAVQGNLFEFSKFFYVKKKRYAYMKSRVKEKERMFLFANTFPNSQGFPG